MAVTTVITTIVMRVIISNQPPLLFPTANVRANPRHSLQRGYERDRESTHYVL